MKKSLLFILLCFTFVISACTNQSSSTSGNFNSTESSQYENMNQEIVNQHLFDKINLLEGEINDLREKLSVSLQLNELGIISKTIDNSINDDIYIGMDNKDNTISFLHVKVPKRHDGYRFYVISGKDTNGVICINSIYRPNILDEDINAENDVDLEKYDVFKLDVASMSYDETTIMIIIAIEYDDIVLSQYIHSEEFSGDT